jgi:hypothetical protein
VTPKDVPTIPKKRSLPPPFNLDFTGIVTRVSREREESFSALVNSLIVASYLKAGVTLIERALGVDQPFLIQSDSHSRPYWSGLRFLTQRAIIDEVERIKPPFERRKGEGAFRKTWKCQDDFINDLLTFFFHPINYDQQYCAGVATRGSWFADGDSFVEAIDRTASHEVSAMCRMPLFRLQIMLAATANRTDGIRAAISDNYRGALAPWMEIYEETFRARGLRVRDLTIPQLADILAANVEGFAIRHLGDPTADVIGETPDGNLVGAAIIGILNSYLVPIDQVDEEPLRVEFDRRTRRTRPAD